MTTTNHAMEQAKAQMESIREMVAALECDYDRLEELRDERKDLADAVGDAGNDVENADDGEEADAEKALAEATAALEAWDGENADELKELEATAGECKDQDDARERIEQDALSVEVRSGWTTPGEPMTPEEFMILLCTGGPACRIVGDLDDSGEPYRARIEYQDWGTPWTELICDGAGHAAMLTYARCFVYAG